MIADETTEDWLQSALERYASDRQSSLRDEIQERADWLALRSARRFADAGEQFDDLLQVARLGLFNAIERYDPKQGVPFGAFATPTIMGELKRHFRDHTWSVHVPRRAKELRPAVNVALHELSVELGRAPRIDEVARRLKVSDEAVLEALDANNAYRAGRLDPTRDAHTPSADSATDLVLDRDVVARLLGRLPERERKVLYLRFYEELSQSQIAERIGTSQVHVGRILAASFEKLRAHLAEDPADQP